MEYVHYFTAYQVLCDKFSKEKITYRTFANYKKKLDATRPFFEKQTEARAIFKKIQQL